MTHAQAFIVVESQLSNFGLTPLTAARAEGFHTVLVSNNPDRYRTVSTAQKVYAEDLDEIIVADTNSVDEVVKDLAPVSTDRGIAGIMTVTDYNLTVVAEVAHRLGQLGLSPAAADQCRDKYLMREACAAAGVPSPARRHVTTESAARAAAVELGYPCVVKPMTESASIGVAFCRNVEMVLDAFHRIAASATNFRGQQRRPGVLIEEYLLGSEVSVEVVLVNGHREVLGVTDKNLGPHPHFVETGETFPSMLSSQARAACTSVALAALEAVSHDFGAAHVEVKLTAEGPRLVEVNGRIAGGEIGRLIREATGIDLIQQVVRMHAGLPVDLNPTRNQAAASRCLLAATSARLRAVHGTELARRSPGVVDVDLEVGVGDLIAPPESNLDLLGHVVAVGDTTGDAVRRAETALGQLSLETDGDDLAKGSKEVAS